MEKTINIQNYADINAEGKLNSRQCKPVICLETGDVYTSVTDAANAIGCRGNELSSHLTGKRRSIKGKHFCYLSRAMESLDVIVARLRKTSVMEDDAAKWRAYQAEQEAIRKAEEKRIEDERKAKEKHQADIEKAKAKVENRHKICSRLEQRWREAMIRAEEAEKEYAELTGNAYDEEDCEEVWTA